MMSSYQDPSFREAHRELARLTPAAIIEWLKRQGTFDMPAVNQQKTARRKIKENAFILLPTVLGTGLVLGWLLRMFWYG